MSKIKVVYKEPDRDPVVIESENNVDALHDLVQGFFECVTWEVFPDRRYLMIVNDEGKINGMAANFAIFSDRTGFGGRNDFFTRRMDVIYGPAVWVRVAGEDFTSLDQDEIDFIFDYLGYGPDDEDDIIVDMDPIDALKKLLEG